jgi:hypothetical protein
MSQNKILESIARNLEQIIGSDYQVESLDKYCGRRRHNTSDFSMYK